jgi:hypothetical protein
MAAPCPYGSIRNPVPARCYAVFGPPPLPANIGEAYTFQNLMIDRGCDLLIVDAQPIEVTEAGVRKGLQAGGERGE